MIIEPYDPSHVEGIVRLSLRAWSPGHGPARAAYERAGFGLFPVARYFKKLQARS